MAGNSKRRGAIKKTGKGNPTAGSGGRVKRGLEARGPTPKAEDRPQHKAYRLARAADKREFAKPRKKVTDTEWVAGRNSVVEALRARVPVTTLYFAEQTERDDRLREILRIGADRNLPMSEVSRLELDRLTTGAVHQGVAAKVPAYEYAHPDDLLQLAADAHEPPLIVALDSVTDPRNLGAVVRSASGFGAHGVLIPERRSAGMTAAAWRTSAGAAARLPVARCTNLARTLGDYRDAGLFVAGLAADAAVSLDDLELATEPLVLVVGSEGEGLGRLVEQSCDVTVSIPMADGNESLNAGIAAAVTLAEVARRRRTA